MHSPSITRYRDLRVWQRAMDLVVDVYRMTDAFPRHEQYGLTAQLRRAAVSVPSNVAEGHARKHTGDYLRQLSFARGSLVEVETQVLIAERLGYVTAEGTGPILKRTDHIGRMLSSLVRALNQRVQSPVGRLKSKPQAPSSAFS